MLITHCVNLAQIHGDVTGRVKGRKSRETSLNRAIVVLAVAAWQTAAEDFAAMAVAQALPNRQAQPQSLLSQIEALASPTPARISRLLSNCGVEPVPEWVNYKGRRPKGGVRTDVDLLQYLISIAPHGQQNRVRLRRDVGPTDPWHAAMAAPISRLELDVAQWVRLRHSIAHGDTELPSLDVLQGVRAVRRKAPAGPPQGVHRPTVRLEDARDCVEDMCRIVQATARSLDSAFTSASPQWAASGELIVSHYQVDLNGLRRPAP